MVSVELVSFFDIEQAEVELTHFLGRLQVGVRKFGQIFNSGRTPIMKHFSLLVCLLAFTLSAIAQPPQAAAKKPATRSEMLRAVETSGFSDSLYADLMEKRDCMSRFESLKSRHDSFHAASLCRVTLVPALEVDMSASIHHWSKESQH